MNLCEPLLPRRAFVLKRMNLERTLSFTYDLEATLKLLVLGVLPRFKDETTTTVNENWIKAEMNK